MTESPAASNRPPYYLRAATLDDSPQIHALTRQLHQSAIAKPAWLGWIIGFIVTLFLTLTWHYPGLVAATILSSAPLWLTILFTLWVAQHEEHKQCDRYWVVEHNQQLIGCGRIDQHPQHAEIYDLFVRSEWRDQGIGQRIMTQLIAQTQTPIYLASLPPAVAFYQRLGFKPINPPELPPALATRLSLNSPRYRRVGLQPMVLIPETLIPGTPA